MQKKKRRSNTWQPINVLVVTRRPAQRWHSCDLAQQMEGLFNLPRDDVTVTLSHPSERDTADTKHKYKKRKSFGVLADLFVHRVQVS